MNGLFNYTTGGTIHIVVNNQIGFTTAPINSRSGLYCTDLGKSIDAPIIHVNADSVENIIKACQIATEYRQEFGNDVIIDIIGFRRNGHNELDQPRFTQPLMYKQIDSHDPVCELYQAQLLKEGVITEEYIDKIEERVNGEMEVAYQESKKKNFKMESWHSDVWEELKKPEKYGAIKDTGVDIAVLKDLGDKITRVPEEFKLHKNVA